MRKRGFKWNIPFSRFTRSHYPPATEGREEQKQLLARTPASRTVEVRTAGAAGQPGQAFQAGRQGPTETQRLPAIGWPFGSTGLGGFDQLPRIRGLESPGDLPTCEASGAEMS